MNLGLPRRSIRGDTVHLPANQVVELWLEQEDDHETDALEDKKKKQRERRKSLAEELRKKKRKPDQEPQSPAEEKGPTQSGT